MQIRARAQARRHVIPLRSLPVYLSPMLAIAACLTWALYLGYGAATGVPLGFPLDDSWIHQTFARNLAREAALAFNPGEPSTGSTSPIWTALLAVGYLLPIDPRIWAYGLGLLFLALSAAAVYQLARSLLPDRPGLHLAAALGTMFEWHLAWAALSGMETTLFIWLSLLLVLRAFGGAGPLALGLFGGLLTLTRPEGVVIFGLAIVWRSASALRAKGQRLPDAGFVALAAAAWGAVVAPIIAYNVAVSGVPLPATYYAKNTAYAVSVGPVSISRFLIRAALELAIGPLLLLYPGLAYLGLRRVSGLRSLVPSWRAQRDSRPLASASRPPTPGP
ncbi:MAG: hypothetical protein HY331_11030, partial [Chloroflexi bacterium]|nr:hypothetical protein [Chloroflexota bacterium]